MEKQNVKYKLYQDLLLILFQNLILYNVKYVIEMLENMTSEDVVFFLSKTNESGFSYQASLIKEKGGKSFSGLIMPMIE